MKLPKRLDELVRKKEIFLDEARAKLEGTALKLQLNLFEEIISEIIPKLDVKDGVLVDNANNYKLISQLDQVYNTFNTKVAGTILPQINSGINTIVNFGTDYFTLAIADLPARFEKVIEGAKTLTDLKIGLRQGKMIRGGQIMSAIQSNPAELQSIMSKSVTSQAPMKEFIKSIKEYINGVEANEELKIKAKSGMLDRQLKQFTYDTYQQYDAAYNKKLAEEFEMRYFIYQGGIMKDSRDFCVCHNNKVYSTEEAQTWKEWKPSDCTDYPEGWPKAKDLNVHPGYMDYPGYDPLTDRGGYNCRHILGYISDGLAFKMRPELKETE